jgi:hypothetical protein
MLVGAAVVADFFLRRLREHRKRCGEKKQKKKCGSDHTARSIKSV